MTIKKVESKASVGNLPIALDHLESAFNIGNDFQAIKFIEKANTLEVTVANSECEITVKFRDKEMIEGIANDEIETEA